MDFSRKEDVDSADDFFDRLPDEIVLSIFKKLQDAKSLCMSMAACKRFRSIAPQVDEISLSIPKKRAASDSEKGVLKHPVVRVLMKPFNFISQMIKSRSKNDENDLDFYSNYLQNEILKSFGEIRGLNLRLPCHGNRNGKSGRGGKVPKTFLRWTAEFGRDLHRCVILGAKSFTQNSGKEEPSPKLDEEARALSDGDLKMRIVWTISCLIAASARHYLVQETVKRQGTIENVVVLDESNQGRLLMNKDQIEELRDSKGTVTEDREFRTRVPALRMKMWYVDSLEVGDSGRVMEGATLVVIKPATVSGSGGGVDGVEALGFGAEGEGKILEEAARKLMVAKKCYTLEMNSF